ncbi:hypothetical protein GS896_25460 [Rhodococcus hoagii]|nr:hypothetical protein [Prescottella equi]MBM4654147.1 hypothetical protein [Prescottella equi]MBM4719620.1 hypothetical protein [Prescottella equi]NKR23418.1 hypothetical protein [Prescottella equi]NKT55970.1 hypothetical protein [Prescottella equi]
MATTYRVTATADSDKSVTTQEFTFDSEYPFSGDLVEIMRKLDEQYRTVKSIEVIE